MSRPDNHYTVVSGLRRYRLRRILYIAVFWTLIDIVVSLLDDYLGQRELLSLGVRTALVFFMSLIMGYLFVFTLRNVFRHSGLWVNFLAKSVIILVAALLMNFLVHFVENRFMLNMSWAGAARRFFFETVHPAWLLKRTLYWIVLFIVTQLYIEINDKYAPGVFLDIIAGKYLVPKVEKRIVMFMDLKDSTPIAEKLGHGNYFLFIREFIYHLSIALIEHEGIIYQYVGDEIVVSWLYSKRNARHALASVITSRKYIQRNSERFRRQYGLSPEFRVGIHVGNVTIGEIGVIKKDLAMSGDTMNTTARIRSACNELSQKFIASRDFVEASDLKTWQTESLGLVELKGKAAGVELFALKI